MSIWHIVVAGAVLLAAFAQMLLKKSASMPHGSFIAEYVNPWVICGYAMLLASMVIDVWAISRGVQVKEVSTIESCSYLFVPVLSLIFFKETITIRKAASIALILCGVIVFFL